MTNSKLSDEHCTVLNDYLFYVISCRDYGVSTEKDYVTRAMSTPLVSPTSGCSSSNIPHP
jgi:hypothetical protein